MYLCLLKCIVKGILVSPLCIIFLQQKPKQKDLPMLIRQCIYSGCEYEFEYLNDEYTTCPQCGAASVVVNADFDTIPPEKEVSDETVNRYKKTIYKASKCNNASICQGINTYRPECETKYKQYNCLINLNIKTDFIISKLSNQ